VWQRRLGCLIFTGHFPQMSQWLVCGRTHTHTEDKLFFHTHYNTLQHTATHCNTLQHTATHCNTLQHTATPCVEDTHTRNRRYSMGQHTTTFCNTLQHSATPFAEGRTHTWNRRHSMCFGRSARSNYSHKTSHPQKEVQIEICKYPQKRLTYSCQF